MFSRVSLLWIVSCLLAAAPAAAGELAFGKAPPQAKPGHGRSDHCVAAYGEGFSDLGGTGACVKIGGRVRVDFGATRGSGVTPASGPSPLSPDKSSQFGAAAQGFAEADVRQPIGGQTLRVFARVRSGAGDDFLLRGNPR